MFAKMIESFCGQQIVVVQDKNEEGAPELIFLRKIGGIKGDVIMQKMTFQDTDGGWETYEEMFYKTDQEFADILVKGTVVEDGDE